MDNHFTLEDLSSKCTTSVPRRYLSSHSTAFWVTNRKSSIKLDINSLLFPFLNHYYCSVSAMYQQDVPNKRNGRRNYSMQDIFAAVFPVTYLKLGVKKMMLKQYDENRSEFNLEKIPFCTINLTNNLPSYICHSVCMTPLQIVEFFSLGTNNSWTKGEGKLNKNLLISNILLTLVLDKC